MPLKQYCDSGNEKLPLRKKRQAELDSRVICLDHVGGDREWGRWRWRNIKKDRQGGDAGIVCKILLWYGNDVR